jgi:hypothetical protein
MGTSVEQEVCLAVLPIRTTLYESGTRRSLPTLSGLPVQLFVFQVCGGKSLTIHAANAYMTAVETWHTSELL